MSTTNDVMLLAADDAVVTLGAQFREVALGLLITQLYPAASSYAWYFLVGSLPGFFLARFYGWASLYWPPRRVMMVTYGVRLLLVLGLWQVQSFWEALACLAGLSIGRGVYAATQSHYVAHSGDIAATRHIMARLRQAEGTLRLVGPLLAGGVLTMMGYRSGFLLSALCYGATFMLVSRLSFRPPAYPSRGIHSPKMLWHPDMVAIAMFGLNFLTWQANTLAMAYTFHILHRHALGYGIILSIYGGSAVLAGILLPRIAPRHARAMTAGLFLVLALCWYALFRGVSFGPFVVIGGIEGLSTWLIEDLILSQLYADAQEGRAGLVRARLGMYEELGSILGTATLLVLPARFLVRPLFGALALVATVWGFMLMTQGFLKGSR